MEEGSHVSSPFTDWKRELLHSRELDQPDGRPLYRYRLSMAKFDSLEILLRGQIASMSNLAGLDLVAAHLPGFPAQRLESVVQSYLVLDRPPPAEEIVRASWVCFD